MTSVSVHLTVYEQDNQEERPSFDSFVLDDHGSLVLAMKTANEKDDVYIYLSPQDLPALMKELAKLQNTYADWKEKKDASRLGDEQSVVDSVGDLDFGHRIDATGTEDEEDSEEELSAGED